jgi:hypothetical protein
VPAFALFCFLLPAALLGGGRTGFAQATEPNVPNAPAGRLAPAEVQRLFDAYALVQAQDALKLSDAQYGQFVTRMRALQDRRHRNQQARLRLLRELAQAASGAANDGVLRDRLRAFQEQEEMTASDLRGAYAAIDEVLDLRQQARFRLFEERMEQRKFELLMRARQGRALQNRRRP